ncbi:MAG: hypothetical protein DI551_00675 [Micavibrio aeruginosavorus]|uniref:Uncharacterized protein n=1 Tax=Micavibrio aeruginosavorus TaxID=349221 RepID=A0A2W5PVP9_9BACT|nr:MAG: hypothetical protein DI551_00675 [Micavibrio aeruginosavorus]
MAPQDKEHSRAAALEAWRSKLGRNRIIARQIALEAAQRMVDAKFHRADIARYFAQMMNGAATPDDFTHHSVA